MKLRFQAVFPSAMIAAAALLSTLPPASAESVQQKLSSPSETSRPTRGEPTYSLDTLFSALKIAPDAASAKAIEDRIWAVWTASDSDTCNLLMSREKAATDAKEYDLAVRLLDAVIALKPNYVEAWNRRATVYYLKQDYPHAVADISEVLALEPRHFGALSGLGLILQDIGDDKDALEAYRKALAIDPHLESVPETVKSLTEKVEGRDI
jgi:tetratricopeptide (TPR) repeat protein